MNFPANHSTLSPFLIGCIGALAPEIIRLYKLRLHPSMKWSWSYLLFSFPFILLGGFMAYILEPATSYAAFYTGVSTPFIVTTLAKDSERDATAIQRLTLERDRLEIELTRLQQKLTLSTQNTATTSSEEHQVQASNADSNKSSLRSTGLTSVTPPHSSMRHTTDSRFPQTSPRDLRFRTSKRPTFQSFLKAL